VARASFTTLLGANTPLSFFSGVFQVPSEQTMSRLVTVSAPFCYNQLEQSNPAAQEIEKQLRLQNE
jgi:hypothetical protein